MGGLRVGVHRGNLESIPLSTKDGIFSNLTGYFGSAMSTARELAETAPQDGCVHLLPSLKSCLKVFERMPFSVWFNTAATPAAEAYYLDPWVEVVDERLPREGEKNS